MVSDILIPVNKAMVETDPNADLSFWEVWLPNGSSTKYNFVSVGSMPNYASMSEENTKYDEMFKKVNPQLDQKQIREMITSLRTRYKQEIWWEEDFVE